MDRICNEALLRKVTTPRAAAAHIKNGMTVGFSGFTVIGYPKVLPVELARRAEEGEELGITVITGGNVGDQLDGVLARSGVMKRRYGFQGNRDLRALANADRIQYVDTHVSHGPYLIKNGYLGKIDVAVIEVAAIRADGSLVLPFSVGIDDTLVKYADKLILEVNEAIPLEVVYEDEYVIVVNKPVGMVVHPAPGHPDGTLVNALLFHCGQSLSGINGQLRPGIVHRIDRDTSGLLIAAKNDGAHLALAQQLQDHSLYREYEAVVLGNLREDQGTISLPIARHPTDRKKMAVNHSSGRPAVTHWTVLARYPGYTHVQCRLETGRTHQIRVHMAAQGHPVLGDPVYNGLRKGFPELAGQCLHARRLSFQHPRTGERMTLSSPLPAYFQTVLTRCSRLV